MLHHCAVGKVQPHYLANLQEKPWEPNSSCKAATEVGNRCQQCEMHPYLCFLDVADAGRAFLPQVQRIFQETQMKKAPSPGLR